MTNLSATSSNLRSWQLGLLAVGVCALAASRLSAGTDVRQFLQCWLVGFLFVWEVSVGCLGMLMVYHLTGGNWGRAASSVFAAGAGLLPLVALAYVPIWLGVDQLFPWTGEAAANDPLLVHKAPYLNEQAFQTRTVVYFTVWIFTYLSLAPFRSHSSSEASSEVRMPRRSALGLVLLVVSVSFAAMDWGMSLEPHWFSSIYGAIFVAGGMVTAMAVSVVGAGALRLSNRVPGVGRKRIRRDLGSLMLAMLVVWIYFSFSQYLIIWSADLPEENFWYLHRGRFGWQYFALIVFLLHFVIPFALLPSQFVREHPQALASVAGLILVGEALHMVWMIAPAFYERVSEIPWIMPTTVVGMASLWGAVWLFALNRSQPSLG